MVIRPIWMIAGAVALVGGIALGVMGVSSHPAPPVGSASATAPSPDGAYGGSGAWGIPPGIEIEDSVVCIVTIEKSDVDGSQCVIANGGSKTSLKGGEDFNAGDGKKKKATPPDGEGPYTGAGGSSTTIVIVNNNENKNQNSNTNVAAASSSSSSSAEANANAASADDIDLCVALWVPCQVYADGAVPETLGSTGAQPLAGATTSQTSSVASEALSAASTTTSAGLKTAGGATKAVLGLVAL
jgi:hypothetical protein